MTKQVINIGVEGNDASGDSMRAAFRKSNQNFNELYTFAGKGDGIAFTQLTDTPDTLIKDNIFIVSQDEKEILSKKLVAGEGITIDFTDPTKLTITGKGGRIFNDSSPTFGGNVDANTYAIANLGDPSPLLETTLGYSMDTFAISRGYADDRYINVEGDTMTGPLRVPGGAVGTETAQRQELVGLSGDTMTGPLILSADPNETSNILTAATKNYVDNNAFSSAVNLFVSTNGDDFRHDINQSKRGRALAYAFTTINQAAFKAAQIIEAAANELGPYQKPIFYNDGDSLSTVVAITVNGDHYNLDISNGGGNGTDMRGTGSIATADVRSGLLIRGVRSGAIASILLVGDLNPGGTPNTERYQVYYTNDKTFIVGETLEYADPVKQPNITIYVESGEYYENYPIRIPNNVSLVGDDLRRVIIKPKSGPSGSIWSNTYFRRDKVIDGLTVVDGADEFGYHYLTDPTMELYSKNINSPGGYENAQKILHANKSFIQAEIIAYINYKIANNISPYASFVYNAEKCRGDVGSIVNALEFDLYNGGYSKTFEAIMSFYTNDSSLIVVTAQRNQTLDYFAYIGTIAAKIIRKEAVVHSYQSVIDQVIEFDYAFEPYAPLTVSNLITLMLDVINEDASFNPPKNNNDMDVFLLNDSNRIRTLSCQGHGGFMCVLDPTGQILTKSPYIQQCSSFSKSINAQLFAGGVFIDAFTGNLKCDVLTRDSSTVIQVSGLNYRIPQTPCSFVLDGIRFQIDYISNYVEWDLDGETGGTAQLNLNAKTPDSISYTNRSSMLTPSTNIEIQTAGNRSMLASDFTQINDLGYGILVTNNASFEAVSVFTYYCYRAYYALNGSQIRSLNGSCAYGTYALSAEGSDPTEIPTTGTLKNPMVQLAKTYSTDTLSEKNKAGALIIYVSGASYRPFNTSEIEIDHGSGVFARYEINSASLSGVTALDSSTVWALSINTGGNNDTSKLGLIADVTHNTDVIIRNLQNFEVLHLATITPTRPSTALQFNNDYSIYHVLSYTPVHLDDVGEGDVAAILTLSESYNYVKLVPDSSAGSTANSGQLGSSRINISALTEIDKDKVVGMVFGWGSKIHTITGYETPTQTGNTWGRITFTTPGGTGLSKTTALSAYDNASISIRAGLASGAMADLTVQISVMRATGHDLADIGTGSYAQSNYPSNIYGSPVNPKTQANEVKEIGKGRVFYATTDQDGNFRIGKFFRVDQGTGTVTFAASIALSNLDGLGFKRGVSVSEFSTDDTMTNAATDTVPTQSAVIGYVNKRLGLTEAGGVSSNPIGPGFMPRDGSLAATDNMDMGSYLITNLQYPREHNATDAANKGYVDQFMKRSGGVRSGIDSFTMSSTTVINITDVSRTTNVARVFVDTPHALSIGSIVTIAGAGFLGFDGTRTVTTVPDLLSFTFAFTGTDLPKGASAGTVTIASSIGLNGNKVTGSADPTDLHDLVNKNYVDTTAVKYLSTMSDVTFTSLQNNSLIYYNGTKWVNATISGDVGLTLSGNTLTSAIGAGKVTNAMMSSSASIDQSKLNLNLATANSSGTAVQGISSFNSSFFSVTSGYVSIKDGGITLGKLANIGNGSVLGNNSGVSGAPTEITFSAVVAGGGALTGALFPGGGVLSKTSGGVYSVVPYGTLNTSNTIVQRDGAGNNNADTAVKLLTARKINGVNFDGTADIVISSAAANTLTFGTHLKGSGDAVGYNGGVAVTLSTDATSVNTVSTIVARDSSGNFAAGIITATATQAYYADLAEYYEADQVYEAGTVLMLGGDKEVTLAKGFGTTRVIGVVSTNPAHLMNTGCKGEKVAIALQGRVPCKVIGKIQKGDILQVGLVPGVASVATQPTPGCIIGKALENYDSDRIGVIEVVVGKH